MTDYDAPVDAGEPAGEGESWQAAAERLRGQTRRLHPLVYEVFGDGE